MKFLFLLFLSFNIFADDSCTPELSTGGGQDFNKAIRIVIGQLCEGGEISAQESSARAQVEELRSRLSRCDKKFDCRQVKQAFLTAVVEQQQKGPRLQQAIQALRSDEQTSKFVETSDGERFRFQMGQLERQISDDLERDRRLVLDKTKAVEEGIRRRYGLQRELKRCIEQKCPDQAKIVENIRKVQERFEQDSQALATYKSQLDPDNLSRDLQRSASRYHDGVQEMLLGRVSSDPTCRGLRLKTIEECLEVSEEFRKFVDETDSENQNLSEKYKQVERSLERAKVEEKLLDVMAASSIEDAQHLLGTDEDDRLMLDRIYSRMDDSLLGKYIDEKALAAACAAKDGDLNCNFADSENTSLSTLQIKDTTLEIRRSKEQEVDQDKPDALGL